jgi:Mce-associated membrane protein
MSEEQTGVGWWRALLRPGRFTVAVVILLLVVTAGYLGVRVVSLSRAANGLVQQRATVLATARRDAADLSGYDYRDLGANVRTVTAESTQRFAQQYRAASQNLADALTAQHAVSTGTVVGAGIESDQPDGPSVVVVLVDQTVTNTASPTPAPQHNRLRLSLVESGGRWLLDQLTAL